MSSPVDPKAFEKLRRILPTQLAARRSPGDWHPRDAPEEIAFKLTNRCDLRCSHCYQWSDVGYHRSLLRDDKGRDLSLDVIAKVLAATRELRSNVFLWGGEPLVYRNWDGLVDLLAAEERWTSICTNGTMIERRLESLLRISQHLEMSVSVDGFGTEHDKLRGQGSFAKTMSGLRALIRCKQQGTYHGEISVNCVIGDELVPRLFDLVAFFDCEGVETLYLSFPWYMTAETATRMDQYVGAHFPTMRLPPRASWHSFTFSLDPAHLDELQAMLRRINTASWKLKLRYNPDLSPAELGDFLRGGDKPSQNKTRCLALQTRLDVFPNGDVVSCKFYPEFSVGNLEDASVSEVWHGDAFNTVRETVSTCGLMPACAKCNLLYTRGA